MSKPELVMSPAEWAERHSRLNEFGSRHYSPGICVTMNMIEDTIPKCGFACEWVSPYGFVPEAGCPVHD
jgi:hypothetical protein